MHRLFTVLALAALAALAGCGDDFEVTISTEACVGTTPRLSWTTNKPGVSWVEYGFDESLGLSTPISTEEGTEHSFTLLGTPPLTEVHYRAITEVGGKQREASGVTATAGLPAEHAYLWASVAGMPDDLVERHIELSCGALRDALRDRTKAPGGD